MACFVEFRVLRMRGNANLSCLCIVAGYARTDVSRDSVSGLFTLSTTATALPALELDFTSSSGVLAILRSNLLLLLLVAYVAYFFWELHANRRMRVKDRILSSAFDFVVLAAMVVGIIVDYTHMGIALSFSAAPFYGVYDSPSVSPRPFLLSRSDQNVSVPDFDTNQEVHPLQLYLHQSG